MKNNFKLIATAAAGLESLVARELRNMEVENVTIDDRSRVFFTGDTRTIAQANTWQSPVRYLRLPHRKHKYQFSFPAAH